MRCGRRAAHHRVRNAGHRERLPSVLISSRGVMRRGCKRGYATSCANPILPTFAASVYSSRVNLNASATSGPGAPLGRMNRTKPMTGPVCSAIGTMPVWKPANPVDTGGEASEPAAGSNQAHDQQQQDGADRGIDDLADNAGPDGNAELGEQQAG